MKSAWNFLTVVVLTVLLNFGECTITGWTEPTIGSADGNAAVSVKLDHGLTTTDSLGITIVATTGASSVTYALDAQTPSPTNDVTFALSTAGVLSISAGTLDYATTTSYVLTIIATDNTDAKGTASATVSIQDPPQFASSQYASYICDASTSGATVTTLTATKAVSGSITYSFTSGNTKTDFAISSSGVITAAKKIDAATTGGYQLAVQASDGTLTGSTTLWVAVFSTTHTLCSAATAVLAGFMTLLMALIAVMQ